MSEENGAETRELRETVDEIREERAEEKRNDSWTRWIALITALLAVLAAVAALQSGGLVNQALMRKNDSVLKQAQASDNWSYYQAKGIKRNGAQQTADLLAANPATAALARKYAAEAARYKQDQAAIEKDARKLELQRDAFNDEAAALLERHHFFAYCVTFTQVAIALSAIAALTKRRPVMLISMLAGVAGLIWFVEGVIR